MVELWPWNTISHTSSGSAHDVALPGSRCMHWWTQKTMKIRIILTLYCEVQSQLMIWNPGSPIFMFDQDPGSRKCYHGVDVFFKNPDKVLWTHIFNAWLGSAFHTVSSNNKRCHYCLVRKLTKSLNLLTYWKHMRTVFMGWPKGSITT